VAAVSRALTDSGLDLIRADRSPRLPDS